jgi:hypothetical protein
MRLSLCLVKANEEEMANKNPQSKPEMPKCHWQIVWAVKQLNQRVDALYFTQLGHYVEVAISI